MATPSRMDRLVKLLGGEENLPAKQTPPTTAEQPADGVKEDPFDKLPSVDQFLEENNTPKWWEAKPHLHLPAQPRPTDQSQPASAVTQPQSTYTDGDVNFDFDPRKGEPAPLGISFSPLLAVTKFCYKFVKKDFLQPIATAFFDANKVFNREWDVYYIWSNYFPTPKAITFVPEYQLLAFIDEINEAFPTAKITISDELREDGLVISFDDIDLRDLRPRFLGHSTGRAQYDTWVANLPYPAEVSGTMDGGDRTLAAFMEKMELANEISKNKNKAAKKKRQTETIIKRQEKVHTMLRAQRYLGLLPKKDGESLMPDITKSQISPIDVTKPPPHPFDDDVIFIAIDVEAYERPPRMITEVGIATLDTRDLKTCAPGSVGEDWQRHIRGRHFCIAEYKHIVNYEFIQGCPERFEFGNSEFIAKDKIAETLVSCFKQPFSGNGEASGKPDEKRKVVLVGHDISQDINYLRSIGFNVANHVNTIIDNVDTAEMFRVYTKDPNARSLGSILYEFELTGWNLHNAGNDCVYTLWAMLAICVKAASERGTGENRKKDDDILAKRMEEAVEQAEERVREQLEGWQLEGTEDEDGGVPVPPTASYGPQRKEETTEKPRYRTIGGTPLDV